MKCFRFGLSVRFYNQFRFHFAFRGRFCHALKFTCAIHSSEQWICLFRVHGKSKRRKNNSSHYEHRHCVVFFFDLRASDRPSWLRIISAIPSHHDQTLLVPVSLLLSRWGCHLGPNKKIKDVVPTTVSNSFRSFFSASAISNLKIDVVTQFQWRVPNIWVPWLTSWSIVDK